MNVNPAREARAFTDALDLLEKGGKPCGGGWISPSYNCLKKGAGSAARSTSRKLGSAGRIAKAATKGAVIAGATGAALGAAAPFPHAGRAASAKELASFSAKIGAGLGTGIGLGAEISKSRLGKRADEIRKRSESKLGSGDAATIGKALASGAVRGAAQGALTTAVMAPLVGVPAGGLTGAAIGTGAAISAWRGGKAMRSVGEKRMSTAKSRSDRSKARLLKVAGTGTAAAGAAGALGVTPSRAVRGARVAGNLGKHLGRHSVRQAAKSASRARTATAFKRGRYVVSGKEVILAPSGYREVVRKAVSRGRALPK